MEHSWQVLDNQDADRVMAFASQLNSSPVLARILLNRGIDNIEVARSYFIPQISGLHDPFLMFDMDAAVDRILSALEQKEKILIYGDYDVDGTTATAMMLRFFRALGHPADFYVPDRLLEGYGLSEKGIRAAHHEGFTLMITVDCGITALQEIELARELGIDVIVCDHHQPGAVEPPALAILNPKRQCCTYPFDELAGVGVAFKLLQGLQQRLGMDEELLYELLYLVAIGSAADIVPLVDENRILVKHGLSRVQHSNNPGVRALLELTGLDGKEIGTGQVVFVLAPRINAVGRMGDAGRAVRLLTTSSEGQARNIAAILEAENRNRRQIDEMTLAQAVATIERLANREDHSVFVLNRDDWHPGVIGIVASRIVERYFRPTVMIATENGVGRGSARSIPGFDIYKALKSCEDLMLSFGGHKYAAGLSVENHNIPLLREKLNQFAAETMTPEMLAPKLFIDTELTFRDIDDALLKLLNKMAPFGPQNTRPTFITRDLQVVGSPLIVGSNHLKFKVRKDGVVMDAIGFNLGDKMYRVPTGERKVELVYTLDENDYNGRTTLQLRVKDLR